MKQPGLQAGAEQAVQIAVDRQVQLRLTTGLQSRLSTGQQSRLTEALQVGVALLWSRPAALTGLPRLHCAALPAPPAHTAAAGQKLRSWPPAAPAGLCCSGS